MCSLHSVLAEPSPEGWVKHNPHPNNHAGRMFWQAEVFQRVLCSWAIVSGQTCRWHRLFQETFGIFMFSDKVNSRISSHI